MRHSLAVAALGAVLLAACWAMTSAHPAPAPAPAPAEAPFHDALKKIAVDYRDYGRVDDEMRWAPWLCRMPMPGVAHVSASKDDRTHGRKLYSLFVKDRQSYLGLGGKKPVPVGQVIVKQSWVPEEVAAKADGQGQTNWPPREQVIVTRPRDKAKDPFSGDHFWPYASREGKVYKAAKQADLFIMTKLDPSTPGTDEGWVYGTVTPDGKKVTSAGRVESCRKCHVEAKHDRLFGLRK